MQYIECGTKEFEGLMTCNRASHVKELYFKSNLYIRYSKAPKNVASDMPRAKPAAPPTSLKRDSSVYAGSSS